MRCNAHPHLGGCHLDLGHPGQHHLQQGDVSRAVTQADEDLFEAMMNVADELNQRIADCHQTTACPRCGSPVGVRCRRAGAGAIGAPPLKHPHQQRIRAAGIPLR